MKSDIQQINEFDLVWILPFTAIFDLESHNIKIHTRTWTPALFLSKDPNTVWCRVLLNEQIVELSISAICSSIEFTSL